MHAHRNLIILEKGTVSADPVTTKESDCRAYSSLTAARSL